MGTSGPTRQVRPAAMLPLQADGSDSAHLLFDLQGDVYREDTFPPHHTCEQASPETFVSAEKHAPRRALGLLWKKPPRPPVMGAFRGKALG